MIAFFTLDPPLLLLIDCIHSIDLLTVFWTLCYLVNLVGYVLVYLGRDEGSKPSNHILEQIVSHEPNPPNFFLSQRLSPGMYGCRSLRVYDQPVSTVQFGQTNCSVPNPEGRLELLAGLLHFKRSILLEDLREGEGNLRWAPIFCERTFAMGSVTRISIRRVSDF